MATRLVGWTLEEYQSWAAKHADEARTVDLRQETRQEVRLTFPDRNPMISGYASVFNSFYELWPGFQESVAPGAFAKTIKQDDIRALINHDPNFVLGRTTSGTLVLREDTHGLKYEIVPPDTSFAKDLMVSLKRKDISQSSIGFNIVEQTLKYDKEKDTVSRTLTEVMLFDVSPVTFPASPQTEATVRMKAGMSADAARVIVEPEQLASGHKSDQEFFAELDAVIKSARAPRERK
jgi:hypothetical protein